MGLCDLQKTVSKTAYEKNLDVPATGSGSILTGLHQESEMR